MLHALGNSSSSTGRVLKLSDGERHGRETLVHLREECAGALHLKHVLLVKFTLVYGTAFFGFLRDTFSVGDVDVKADDISRHEFPFVNLLGASLLVDDSVVRVDAVFEDLVRKDGFDGVDFHLGTNARNSSGYVSVLVANADSALGSLHSEVASNDGVGLGAGNLVRFGRTDNNGEGSVGTPSVDVASGNNFADITINKLG